jgi:hypothetical protein
MTQEMVYLIQTLDFDTASKVQLDERFPMIEVKDDRYPYYKGTSHSELPRLLSIINYPKTDGKGRVVAMGYFFINLPRSDLPL